MLVAKQVADLITVSRALLGFGLAWLGLTQGAESLPLAVGVMILSWTTDALDGPIARRSRVRFRTWVGDHDLEVDMTVGAGLLIYLLASGFVSAWLAALYFVIWAVVFLRLGIPRSLGMLFQAPIYSWFIWIAIRDAPEVGRWLVIWILVALIVTWPHFPKEMVPGFLFGMRKIRKEHRDGNHTAE